MVKRAENIERLDFDYGFVCLECVLMHLIYLKLKRLLHSEDVEIINIGDSVRARRIIDGVSEGRNIINILKRKEFMKIG